KYRPKKSRSQNPARKHGRRCASHAKASLISFVSERLGAITTPNEKKTVRRAAAAKAKANPMRRPYHKTKPRIQGKIAQFTDEQREKLHSWFREHLTYDQIRAAIEREFGVRIAASSLSNYFSKHSFEIPGEAASIKTSNVEAEI